MENNSENDLDNKIQETTPGPKLDATQPSAKKKLAILGVVALLVMAAAVTAVYKLYEPPVIVPGCNPGDKFSQTSGLPCSEVESTCENGELYDRNTGDPCVGALDDTAAPGELYQTTLKTYEGQSILLDGACVPSSKLFTVPLKTKVLIANNSQKILEVTAPGKNIILPPYRTTLSSPATVGEFPVTCNGKAVSTIKVI